MTCYDTIESQDYTYILLMNKKKHSNSVNHEKLLCELDHYRILENVYDLIKSFLTYLKPICDYQQSKFQIQNTLK